ncbi:hypothetical protein D3C83_321110 [compost metagenome]
MVETSISGVRYMPTAFFTMLKVGINGATAARYPPMLPKLVIRRARKRPSRSSASSA